MSGVDFAAIAETFAGVVNLTLREPDAKDLHRMPHQWQAIAATADPQTRLATALGLWNAPLLEALPEFATALRTRFTDVRPCLADDERALLYLAEDPDGNLLSWIGFDPASFVEPQFWEHFPEPVQMFLRHVHAGFTSGSRTDFGLMHPRHMQTVAEQAGEPGGIADWDEVLEIASTRLLLVTSDGGGLDYCVSPDLEADHLALVFEADIDPTPYGPALDTMLYDVLSRPAAPRAPAGQSEPPTGSGESVAPVSSGPTIGTNPDGLSAVTAARIISLAEICCMPRFAELSPEGIHHLATTPMNLQWLSYRASRAKFSRGGAAGMSGVDPYWQASQIQLENEVRNEMQNAINSLLRSQD